jgi:hypothetical protein
MTTLGNPLLLGGEGYQISRSVRLRSSASGYFNRTLTTPTDNKKWTFSVWGKRGNLGSLNSIFGTQDDNTASGNWTSIRFNTSNQLEVFQIASGAYSFQIVTTRVFRDPSAFYNISVLYDSANATASERVKVYVNGEQVTAFATASYPALNTQTYLNQARIHYIGAYSAAPSSIFYTFDGYLTEINFIDGQALTPSSFGETDVITGVWKPKKYAGTYGTNGFFLNFADNSAATAAAIGKDNSGNGNNWTPNNISVTAGATYDSMLDVPTLYADGGNGRGNYCTLNPLGYKPSATTITQANLRVTTNTSSAFGAVGSIAVDSGKWYWEATFAGGQYMVVGISSATTPITTDTFVGGTATSYGYYNGNGQKYNNGTGASYGATYTTNDVIGVALDLDAGTLTFYKNGTTQGTAFTSLSGLFTPAFSDVDTPSGACDIAVNFGQRPFAYTPPTGFKALNTQNLPEPTIKKGNAYFDVTTYTGTGSARSVTGLGFQPDLVWVKGRSVAYSHLLTDSVRGVSKRLVSDSNAAEVTDTDTLTAFNSDGFSWGTGIGGNQNAATYAAWQWKESASAGFDIVTYTGTGANRTVSHSLGVAPSMIIFKRRNSTSNWPVYHVSNGNTAGVYLNGTNAKNTSVDFWNNTSPTSTVFTLGAANEVNVNTSTNVAYCFSEVAGFSKFGSYTGNGSTDGPFVFCGFRPRFVMVKRTDAAENWEIIDTARNAFNAADLPLYPNLSNAEAATSPAREDVLSNGFKLRTSNGGVNASGGTYIFAAFAEHPFKNSLAR